MTAGDHSRTVGHTVIDVALADHPYRVLVGDGILGRMADATQVRLPLPAGAGRAVVVTQQPIVDAGHLAPVEASLDAADVAHSTLVVPDGEAAKDVGVLAEIWRACAAAPLSRDDVIVAVGGGVVGDLGGFAAATYNRGVAVLQVPTTLLAQVDAAIGGKTGINLGEGKNLVGAFHQPTGVVCDIATLATLTPRLRIEGLGEIVKAGLIADPAILATLEAESDAVVAGDAALLRELVERSVRVKAHVVADDEREQGSRAHLNFGHTYAHAVEALTGYADVLHGEAVAIGLVVALRLGVRLGRTPVELAERGEELLERLGLPTRGPTLDRAQVWRVMARDKKAGRDGVRFVVLDDLARPTVLTPDPAQVDAVLDDLERS